MADLVGLAAEVNAARAAMVPAVVPSLPFGMIVGHLGLAYAARARWPRAPLAWLMLATMAPDLARTALDLGGVNRWTLNEYTHLLPWSLALAAAAALLALTQSWRRGTGAALLVGVLVLSHIALDMISGHKPLWVGGPIGLDVQRYQQLELLIEGTLLVGGWWLLRRAEPRSMATRATVLGALLAAETVYLAVDLNARPYATRCIEYPLQPCWVRRGERPPDASTPLPRGKEGLLRQRSSADSDAPPAGR